MIKLGRRIWYIIVLSIFGLLLSSPQRVYAETNSGRSYQLMFGHAYGDDLDTELTIQKGETRHCVIIPQYRYLRGVDGYRVTSLYTNDEFIDKYNKDFIKERKGYKLEAVAADSTIIQTTNNNYGSYNVKGLKEGQTVIRFYETYLGVKRYLGCRRVIVGTGDLAEDTVTIFVGSGITVPSNWISINSYSDGFDGTDKNPIPKDKSLFKKEVVSKDYFYYKAIKTGETTATLKMENKKITFKVKIVEPAISKKAKKEYSFYEGYRLYLDANYGVFSDLFDGFIESSLIEGVSNKTDVVEIAYKQNYLYFNAKKSGKAKIDLYYKLDGKSKHLGQFAINVIKSNNTEYISELVKQNMVADGETVNEVKIPYEVEAEVKEEVGLSDDDYINITDRHINLRVGDHYQFNTSSSRDFDIKWRVSDASKAEIESSTGSFTAMKAGTVIVYAETPDLFSDCYVDIVERDAIIINGEKVITGERSITLYADYDNVTWRISDSTKAIIQAEGNQVALYPIDIGTVVLYAESGSSRGELTITIEDVGVDYHFNYFSQFYEDDNYNE